jgi:hypothetical protein
MAFLHFRGLGVRQDTPRALELLEQAANTGHAQAAWALYEQFTISPYVVKNDTLAAQWLQRAADLGSAPAACSMAQMLDRADPLAPSRDRIVALLEGFASQADGAAQSALALWHMEGKHGLKDKQLALKLFRRAARGGNAFAQAWLGDALATGKGIKANPKESAVWYELAALQGHGGAIRALTKVIVSAGSAPEEMLRLFKLWHKSAERGDADAQRVVGDFFMRGVGVERSAADAERWLTASVEQGNAAAMVMLGGFILENPDNAARFPEAVALFRRAAAKGNTDAEYNLGVCLRRGLGVRPNAKAAELKYRAAAEKNHLSAQLALGDALAETAATEAEWLDAAHWYQLAADSGNATAQTRLADIRKNRLRSDVSEGATSAAS